MNTIAKSLTDYIIKKGMIKEKDRVMYEFGFLTGLEKGISLFLCFLITIPLHMLLEGILFFIIFIPLRSFAGGLHLKHYYSCLILSCLVFSVVLLICKYVTLPLYITLLFFIILAVAIYILNPVDNINRKLDMGEKKYFRKQLKKYILIDLIIVILCAVLKKESYLLLIISTFLMVFITMIIGKIKNSKQYGTKCCT